MTVEFDPSGDWEILDNVQTVTLYRRTGNSTFAAEIVTHAARFEATRAELESLGLVATKGRVFVLYSEKLTTGPPRVNDVIGESDGARWMVGQVQVRTEASRYRCVCVGEV